MQINPFSKYMEEGFDLAGEAPTVVLGNTAF